MDKVKVLISNNQKQEKIPTGIRILLRRCCNAVIALEKLSGEYEVNITFVDDEQIRELNKTHRDIDKSTDVLSFPLGEDGVYDYKNPEPGEYASEGPIVLGGFWRNNGVNTAKV